MEDQAEQLIRRLLPDEWIIRNVPKDYGVDLEIEMVDQDFVTGNRIWVQSKATTQIERHVSEYDIAKMGLTPDDVPEAPDGVYRAGYFPYRVDVKELEYALRCPVPLLLFVCDLQNQDVFWLPLRDEVLCSLASTNMNWRIQGTATVRVPEWNSVRWEGARGFSGLKWYALEPARMTAFVNLHYYHHEFQYTGRLSGYEIGTGFIDHGEEEELRAGLRLAKQYVEAALRLDVLFGEKGIDFFTTPLPGFGIQPIAFQLRDALQAADAALTALETGGFDFASMTVLVGRVGHAVDLLSTSISAYQGFRQKFLFTEAGVMWRAGAKVHGFEGPPIMPTDRQRSRGA